MSKRVGDKAREWVENEMTIPGASLTKNVSPSVMKIYSDIAEYMRRAFIAGYFSCKEDLVVEHKVQVVDD